jgi:hypothetical protein
VSSALGKPTFLDPNMADRRRFASATPSFFAVIGLSLLLLAGCGAELYQQRLDNTKKLFAHLELLNAHLHQYWGDPATGTRLRLPLQFAMIPAPAPPAKEAGDAGQENDEIEVVVDDRQPKYLNIELPGLRGAFFAKMSLLDAGAASVDPYGFIYVLSNHHLYEYPDKAREFHTDLVAMLSETTRTGVRPEDWRDEKFPLKVGTFADTVLMKSVVLTPSELIGGLERQFSVYMFSNGDVRVAVLFVIPKDVNSSEKMVDRIPLCLETLRVAGDRLSAPAATPAGGPTGTGTSF